MTRLMTKPFRVVVSAHLIEGRVGIFTANGIYSRWYELTLECDHLVERTARYRPHKGSRRGWARLHNLPSTEHVLPPPKRVRCDFCPTA